MILIYIFCILSIIFFIALSLIMLGVFDKEKSVSQVHPERDSRKPYRTSYRILDENMNVLYEYYEE